MKELPLSWKMFRIACILQMVFVGLELMLSVRWLFRTEHTLTALLEIIAYGVIFIFLYKGLSILNYNYPDTPLSDKQKRQFNWLFIINTLLVAFLFSQVVIESRWAFPLLKLYWPDISVLIWIALSLILGICIFLLHLVFLAGMFRLRRTIYLHTLKNWSGLLSDETGNQS